jgi:hypothetical protein
MSNDKMSNNTMLNNEVSNDKMSNNTMLNKEVLNDKMLNNKLSKFKFLTWKSLIYLSHPNITLHY